METIKEQPTPKVRTNQEIQDLILEVLKPLTKEQQEEILSRLMPKDNNHNQRS
jgi:hypothetical protein